MHVALHTRVQARLLQVFVTGLTRARSGFEKLAQSRAIDHDAASQPLPPPRRCVPQPPPTSSPLLLSFLALSRIKFRQAGCIHGNVTDRETFLFRSRPSLDDRSKLVEVLGGIIAPNNWRRWHRFRPASLPPSAGKLRRCNVLRAGPLAFFISIRFAFVRSAVFCCIEELFGERNFQGFDLYRGAAGVEVAYNSGVEIGA